MKIGGPGRSEARSLPIVTVKDVLTRPMSSSCSGSATLATFGRPCREAELSAAVEDAAAIAELTPAELDEIRRASIGCVGALPATYNKAPVRFS